MIRHPDPQGQDVNAGVLLREWDFYMLYLWPVLSSFTHDAFRIKLPHKVYRNCVEKGYMVG